MISTLKLQVSTCRPPTALAAREAHAATDLFRVVEAALAQIKPNAQYPTLLGGNIDGVADCRAEATDEDPARIAVRSEHDLLNVDGVRVDHNHVTSRQADLHTTKRITRVPVRHEGVLGVPIQLLHVGDRTDVRAACASEHLTDREDPGRCSDLSARARAGSGRARNRVRDGAERDWRAAGESALNRQRERTIDVPGPTIGVSPSRHVHGGVLEKEPRRPAWKKSATELRLCFKRRAD